MTEGASLTKRELREVDRLVTTAEQVRSVAGIFSGISQSAYEMASLFSKLPGAPSSRCAYCTTLRVKDRVKCPSCGAPYP